MGRRKSSSRDILRGMQRAVGRLFNLFGKGGYNFSARAMQYIRDGAPIFHSGEQFHQFIGFGSERVPNEVGRYLRQDAL